MSSWSKNTVSEGAFVKPSRISSIVLAPHGWPLRYWEGVGSGGSTCVGRHFSATEGQARHRRFSRSVIVALLNYPSKGFGAEVLSLITLPRSLSC